MIVSVHALENLTVGFQPDTAGYYSFMVHVTDKCNATSVILSNITIACDNLPTIVLKPGTAGIVRWDGQDAPNFMDKTHVLGWYRPHHLDARLSFSQPIDLFYETLTAAGNLTRHKYASWWSAPAWQQENINTDGLRFQWVHIASPAGSMAVRSLSTAQSSQNASQSVNEHLHSTDDEIQVVHAIAPRDGKPPMLLNANTAKATFVPDVIGLFEFELIVSNACYHQSARVDVTFTCNSPPQVIVNDTDMNNGLCLFGKMVHAYDTWDADADPLYYSWSVNSAGFGNGTPPSSAGIKLNTTSGPVTFFKPDVTGEYSLKLQVTDACVARVRFSRVVVFWQEHCTEMSRKFNFAIIMSLSLYGIGTSVLFCFWYRSTPLRADSPLSIWQDAFRLQQFEKRFRGTSQTGSQLYNCKTLAARSCAQGAEQNTQSNPVESSCGHARQLRVLRAMKVFATLAELASISSLAFTNNLWWPSSITTFVPQVFALWFESNTLYTLTRVYATCVLAIIILSTLRLPGYVNRRYRHRDACPQHFETQARLSHTFKVTGHKSLFASISSSSVLTRARKYDYPTALQQALSAHKAHQFSTAISTGSEYVGYFLFGTWSLLLYALSEVLFIPVMQGAMALLTCSYFDQKFPYPHLVRDEYLTCWTGQHLTELSMGIFIILFTFPLVLWYGTKAGQRFDLTTREIPGFFILRASGKYFACMAAVCIGSAERTRSEPLGAYGIPKSSSNAHQHHALKDLQQVVILALISIVLLICVYTIIPFRGRVCGQNVLHAVGYTVFLWATCVAWNGTIGAQTTNLDRPILDTMLIQFLAGCLPLSLFTAVFIAHRAKGFMLPDISTQEMLQHRDMRARATAILALRSTTSLAWPDVTPNLERKDQTAEEDSKELQAILQGNMNDLAVQATVICEICALGWATSVAVRMDAMSGLLKLADTDNGVYALRRACAVPVAKRMMQDRDSTVRLCALSFMERLSESGEDGLRLILAKDEGLHRAAMGTRKDEWLKMKVVSRGKNSSSFQKTFDRCRLSLLREMGLGMPNGLLSWCAPRWLTDDLNTVDLLCEVLRYEDGISAIIACRTLKQLILNLSLCEPLGRDPVLKWYSETHAHWCTMLQRKRSTEIARSSDIFQEEKTNFALDENVSNSNPLSNVGLVCLNQKLVPSVIKATCSFDNAVRSSATELLKLVVMSNDQTVNLHTFEALLQDNSVMIRKRTLEFLANLIKLPESNNRPESSEHVSWGLSSPDHAVNNHFPVLNISLIDRCAECLLEPQHLEVRVAALTFLHNIWDEIVQNKSNHKKEILTRFTELLPSLEKLSRSSDTVERKTACSLVQNVVAFDSSDALIGEKVTRTLRRQTADRATGPSAELYSRDDHIHEKSSTPHSHQGKVKRIEHTVTRSLLLQPKLSHTWANFVERHQKDSKKLWQLNKSRNRSAIQKRTIDKPFSSGKHFERRQLFPVSRALMDHSEGAQDVSASPFMLDLVSTRSEQIPSVEAARRVSTSHRRLSWKTRVSEYVVSGGAPMSSSIFSYRGPHERSQFRKVSHSLVKPEAMTDIVYSGHTHEAKEDAQQSDLSRNRERARLRGALTHR
eukprot:CAMPEP_0183794970 /NCGR_PEP_ID=MMETSP0803_2-20130417/4145_1 /TAXON_ID=195967 /ORGANISM="Crustomastix stigmata, Strain CCMP3273" /LENGTH=1588 /DNA_ID=CAMNT_0026039379 /DNA_START=492 /DNA_END=5258 /DNA_ORIENTATION=-